VETGLRLPFLLTRSKFSTQLQVAEAVGLRQINDFGNDINQSSRFVPLNDTLSVFFRDELNNGQLIYNRLELSFFNLLKRSLRDLRSKWGQTLNIEYHNTPFEGDFRGNLFAVRSNLYFPGLFKHHSSHLSLAHQRRKQAFNENGTFNSNQYYFNNRIPKPRGYAYPDNELFTTVQGNYLFPFWYPDWNLGPLLNIKRVKFNAFADLGWGRGENFFVERNVTSPRLLILNRSANYQSFGGELMFDVNFMRFTGEFELGLRAVYSQANALSSGGLDIEFVLGSIGF
ncbi:MAG: hypothetical protein AAF193_11645, partial [Bacteroidota bacterium]